ncbi:MAG: TetR/AcrR family transcriptional regulator [Rudaea sp.]|uniref:TetR/AcrR family transcriptional regulator n=1 Tax=unclassified Rudaea TaxID=2627037 RepID=UPI0010F69D16|nr:MULTISPECIES: TetR/AcrR family transcriptional regulator [unclassified Rudaea]MBN8886435.1 TetR/AcrR family transcriptional regulator [Rudaea sp.]
MTKPKPVSPRRLPRQARSQDTLKVLLEAAASVLEKDGLEGYNTNAVAARAGVSIGSLYQYFPHKDALTAALIERERTLLVDEIEHARATPDRKAALTGIIAACVAHQMRRPALARLLDLEEARLPIHQDNRRVHDRVRRAIAACVRGHAATAALGTAAVTDDIFAIVRGIVDAAGERGEVRAAALRSRVERAIFGYLDFVADPAARKTNGRREP